MGFRELVHVVGKLCKRLTRRRSPTESKTKANEAAETTVKTDAQIASTAEEDDTRTRTEPANLDSLPTELLLEIVAAISRGWEPQIRLLAALVQVNRKLASVLMPEARRTFCVWSGRQIETLYSLPDAVRIQIETLFVEARPTLPDAQQPADSTYPWQDLLPGEVLLALQLLPAVRNLLLSFHGVVSAAARHEALRFPILVSPYSPLNKLRVLWCTDTYLDLQVRRLNGSSAGQNACRRLVLYGKITATRFAALALFSRLDLHFPQLEMLRFGPIYMLDDTDIGGRHEIPEIGHSPPTLQYLQVDCATSTGRVPDLPKRFFSSETPTLFCLDYVFIRRSEPYTAEQHPMQYVCLNWLPLSSSKRSSLGDFLLSLRSLRCLFLAQELYDSAGTCIFVDSLAQRLVAKHVDVRKHSNRDLACPVLPEFEDYIKMKQARRAAA